MITQVTKALRYLADYLEPPKLPEEGPLDDDAEWSPERERWPVYGPTKTPITPEFKNFRPMVEEAMALLLLEEFVTLGHDGKGGTSLAVLCSDTFAYACADCEEIPPPSFGQKSQEPFWELYDLVRNHGYLGVVRWVMDRRGYAPIKPYCKRLKEAGLWPPSDLEKIAEAGKEDEREKTD